jgi:hypothetical protein
MQAQSGRQQYCQFEVKIGRLISVRLARAPVAAHQPHAFDEGTQRVSSKERLP